MSLTSHLVFSPFHFDPVQWQLWREAERVPIRPKTLAVLYYLLTHRERVISRDELCQAIWPRRCGSERAPKQCIRELRVLLGDTAEIPRFIETVGRQGYRFIGRLEPPDITGEPACAEKIGISPSTGFSERHCVGREAELTQLGVCLARARRGERPVVFVTGEPGIGKTTLVDVFVSALAPQHGLWVCRGQCVQHWGAAEAYQPLLDLLGRLGQSSLGTRLTSVLERHAPTWLLQLPGLVSGSRLAALQRQTQGATGERMRRELIEALEALAAETPGVVILEDL